MLIVGIDENGLGPVLGPLVVTAVAFEAETYIAEAFWRAAGSALVANDSKQIFSSSKMGSAEVATLAWLEAFGIHPVSYSDLADRIVASPPLRRPCRLLPGFCSPSGVSLPAWATPKELDWICSDALLDSKGISPVSVRAFSICAGMFNQATAGDMNKLALDCRLMLKLIQSLAADHDGEVLALCGKVGSTKHYGPWLQDAGLGLWTPEIEEAGISTYRVVPLGRISFIRDGDASHLPIAVASMIGKYLRELAMRDMNTLLATDDIRYASGYRDKVTAAFIEKTAGAREAIGLAPACFKRNS